jgi:hypothetical protein
MKELVTAAGRGVSFASCALASLILLANFAGAQSHYPETPGIWLSREASHRLTIGNEDELMRSLRRITGLGELHFAEDGSLAIGDADEVAKGSATARQILSSSLKSGFVFIIEDHSNSPLVNFGQLDEGLIYEDAATGLRLLIWRVRLDFQDFCEMQSPREVRASFDAGFTTLHELLHGLGYKDAASVDELGECEEMINLARAELQLPLRDQYFGEPLRIAPMFVSVRLRFRAEAPPVAPDKRAVRRRSLYLFFMLPVGPPPSAIPGGAAALGCRYFSVYR